jgi:predicted amidohydrolase YtcJ
MHLDAIVTGGRFFTLDRLRPQARRIGVLGGLIAGFDEELDGCTAETVHDVRGATVVPGFIDAHHHLSAHGLALFNLDLSPARSVTELQALLRTRSTTLQPGEWLVGQGYDDNRLDRPPHRRDLDHAVPDRPVWILHTSHHQGVLSTAAIRALGFAEPEALVEVPGGYVERDRDGSPPATSPSGPWSWCRTDCDRCRQSGCWTRSRRAAARQRHGDSPASPNPGSAAG